MDAAKRVRHLDANNLIGGIRDIGYQINLENSTPLIADLRTDWTFEDKTKEEGTSITDLVLLALWLLREDI